MMRRLLTGLAGLVVLTAGLVGLPTFLIAVHRALADMMPALGDLPAALLAPGDGGLFLLTLVGIGWVSWLVFAVSVLIELASRIRGVRTPRLGPFLPQRTAAWAITAVTLLATLSPTGRTQPAAVSSAVTASATATIPPTATPTRAQLTSPEARNHSHAAQTSDRSAIGGPVDADGVPWRDYRVKRGDTLWDIADRQLGEPTEWPAIAEASDEIRQPGGRHLADPDLILPGWTLHIPGPAGESAAEPATDVETGTLESQRPPTESAPEVETAPPATPLRPGDSSTPISGLGRRTSATPPGEPGLPATPLNPAGPPAREVEARADDSADHLVASPAIELALPSWVRRPLTPSRFEDAPPQSRRMVLAVLAVRRGVATQATD